MGFLNDWGSRKTEGAETIEDTLETFRTFWGLFGYCDVGTLGNFVVAQILGTIQTIGEISDIMGTVHTFWELFRHFGDYSYIVGYLGAFWGILGHFGCLWDILTAVFSLGFFMYSYYIHSTPIHLPPLRFVPEDAGIESWTFATLALAVRCSVHSAGSLTHRVFSDILWGFWDIFGTCKTFLDLFGHFGY
jgi:hypothetical protein